MHTCPGDFALHSLIYMLPEITIFVIWHFLISGQSGSKKSYEDVGKHFALQI